VIPGNNLLYSFLRSNEKASGNVSGIENDDLISKDNILSLKEGDSVENIEEFQSHIMDDDSFREVIEQYLVKYESDKLEQEATPPSEAIEKAIKRMTYDCKCIKTNHVYFLIMCFLFFQTPP
jgi:hypothetical protein